MAKTVAQKNEIPATAFEKGITVAIAGFRFPGEWITKEGVHQSGDVGTYLQETFASTICWKLERMLADQTARFDKLKDIANDRRRRYDGSEIALEGLKKITMDLRNVEALQLLIEEHLLSAKGVYLDLTGRPYGERRRQAVDVPADLADLDRILGGKTTRIETVGTRDGNGEVAVD
jgi:hypothetical protein